MSQALQILTAFAALAAVISALCAVYVALRTGKWRETDDGKALYDRLGKAERWQDSEPGKQMVKRVDHAHERIQALEIRMEDLPTREDIARLEGEVAKVAAIGARTENAVERIEGYMMERSK
ncbi:MAG TPA: DUF2730 family protein [Caulobacteraceae bacterium]|nr:DUF2730 family protein [Caulobacteraceae bacterium]